MKKKIKKLTKKMMKLRFPSANHLRELWIAFWKAKKHFLVPSHSLVSPVKLLKLNKSNLVDKEKVAQEAISLLWINSGVAGLRQYFLGIKKPPSKRIVNIQKAVRTNDIENIGKTNRHLSFFEMMGNFSLGDYQKKEAILWAWEFLTDLKWLGLDKKKLFITVYHKDEAAIQICQTNLKIAPEHLILGDKNSNFWDLGVGPCGPNLEIFYDLGEKFDPKKQGITLLQKNIDNERYLEIWNIVFSEFLNSGNGKYQQLPTKNIDTGAGLERILTVLQDKNNCFETSLFVEIMEFLSKHLQTSFILQSNDQLNDKQKITNKSFKIIADHSKAVVFLLSDLLETQTNLKINFNNHRGYIIKKLIRNALGQIQFFKINQPFLSEIVPIIVIKMQKFYPNLSKWANKVKAIIANQETVFLSLLQSADKFLNSLSSETISGKEIFRLVTELGVPLSLVKKKAEQKKIRLELDNFQNLLSKHEEKSKTQSTGLYAGPYNLSGLPATRFMESKTIVTKAEVLGFLPNIQNKSQIWIVFDKTPFYPNRGGQICDTGWLISPKGEKIPVLDVLISEYKQYLHLVDKTPEEMNEKNNFFTLKIDDTNRSLIRNNHSATHLLHFALRSIISNRIQQNGSLNNEKGLRLDFSIDNLSLNLEKLQKVEQKVNDIIQEQVTPRIDLVSEHEAKQMKALNFFKVETNSDQKVRVVTFNSYSVELCGGLHVFNTSLMQKFLITRIEKKGANNYRIYALTTNKIIKNFWSSVEENFDLFLKKYRLNFEKLLNHNIFSVLANKMQKQKKFFLLWAFYKNELESKIKKYFEKQQKKLIIQSAQKYIISKSDFYSIDKYCIIWHKIQVSNQIPNHYNFEFLRMVFDQYKNKANTFCFLLIENKNKNNNFIFQFDNHFKIIDWKEFFNSYFQNKIKFGLKENKMQGMIENIDSKMFLQALKTKIKKHLS